jgi:PKD repeat protein
MDYQGVDGDGTIRREPITDFNNVVLQPFSANIIGIEASEPNAGNWAPVLESVGNRVVGENVLLSFTVAGSDVDGDSLTYSVQGLPQGAAFSGRSFSWRPGYDQAGTYEVTFIVSDGQAQDSETITITVTNVNRVPVLAAIGNKVVSENSPLTFTVSATDPDGDSVEHSVQSLPAGASFTSRIFTWTPGYNQAGSHQVTFIASDGNDQDSETITITVSNVNRAPVLEAVGDRFVNENSLLSFSVSADDPDGDTIEYTASGLPGGATFTGQTFNWTPDRSQADNAYQISFAASDGQLQDSLSITITVSSVDSSAPVVAGCVPTADSIQVPLNSLIVLHVTDSGDGVDANSVIIRVDGDVVYSGNVPQYGSTYGICRRSGAKADYTFACQPDETFEFDQNITVTANASDLAGNAMAECSYSFRSEMRSFGQNKKIGSGFDPVGKGAPDTVRDSSGNIWAAWHAGPPGGRDIYISRLAAGSAGFEGGIQLTNNGADQCNPAIALDDNGNMYVVWQDNRRGDWDIYVSTSLDGVSWTGEMRVSDSNDNQVNPAVAVDGQSPNRVHIVWQDDGAGNQDIYIATSSNGFVSKAISRVTSNASDQVEPAVAVNSSNTIYAVWSDARGGSSDIYGAASNNGPWANIPVVTSAGNQSSPAIAAESAGSVLHLLWVDDRAGNNDVFYVASSGLPGSPLNGSSIIDDTSGANQSSPAVVVTGAAGGGLRVFACWQDGRNVGDTDIYFAELTAGSGTNVLVGDNGTNTDQGEPAMGIDSYGYPYIVWSDDRDPNGAIYYSGSTFMEPDVVESKAVSASLGATVGTEPANISGVGDVSVVVPAGACPYDATITISRIQNPQAFSTPCLSTYDFGPSGMVFSVPVTVTIPYAVSADGTSASPYWYDSLTGALSQQGITEVETIVISPTLHALRFKTTHFTPFYVLLGAGAAAGGGGGGGGCSISPAGQGNIVEFLIPYIGLAAAVTVLKLRDARRRKAAGIAGGGR